MVFQRMTNAYYGLQQICQSSKVPQHDGQCGYSGQKTSKVGGGTANASIQVSRVKPTTNSMELSGMPPNKSSGKTTKIERRILQMHQIMKKTWIDLDNITAVIARGMEILTTFQHHLHRKSQNRKHNVSRRPNTTSLRLQGSKQRNVLVRHR